MKVCTKCGGEKGCVWTAEGARCENCFRQATLHAVKTVVSKHRLVSFRSTVCVGTNPPSIATVALLAALHDCLTYAGDRRASRMSFSVNVLHVRVPTQLFGSDEEGEVRSHNGDGDEYNTNISGVPDLLTRFAMSLNYDTKIVAKTTTRKQCAALRNSTSSPSNR